MIVQAGEPARHVAAKLGMRTQDSARRGTFVMGREILVMILNHFRTPGQNESMFTMEHIVRTVYPGDSQLDAFYEKWMEIVTNTRPGDMPPDDWFRNSLYKKIRSSTLLLYDIKQYETWLEGDPRNAYQYLIDSIERTIARIRDDKNMAARDKYARDFTASGRPSPQPKQPAKGNGKKGKCKSRSASPKDKSKIPCHFYFVKKSCTKGRECPYSHDQKIWDNKKKGKGKGGGKSRSQPPAHRPKKIDEPCWAWAKGHCKFGKNCNRRHDEHLYNTAPTTSPTASSATPALIHSFDSDTEDEPMFAKVASSQVRKKVYIKNGKAECISYVKPDYVKCTKTQPRIKVHNKVGKTTDELRKDEQWAYSCRLAENNTKKKNHTTKRRELSRKEWKRRTIKKKNCNESRVIMKMKK